MGNENSRTFAPTAYNFIRSGDAVSQAMTHVEGQQLEGKQPQVKVILVTDRFSCCEYTKFKDTLDPPHAHTDHETFNFLIKGKMRVTIDGEEFIAEPGSYWVHREGVVHANEMLEDCVQLEVKMPPTKTW